MKKTVTIRKNGTRRVQLDLSKGGKTDKSYKAMTDINNIMLAYSKTGVLPHSQEKVARYIDNTLAVSLEDAHALLSDAKEMFYEFPARIRKLMDNDPTKLESFIKDPQNQDILIQEGLLVKKVEKVKPSDPPSVDKTKEAKDA